MSDQHNISFSSGDAAAAKSIIKESAQWLIDQGNPTWSAEEIDAINYPGGEYLVMRVDGEPAGACVLCFVDRDYWPDIPDGESGYIHKLAMRPAFAGLGLSAELVRHAISLCKDKGIGWVRLDCRADKPRLRAHYERLGFRLVAVRRYFRESVGEMELALYERLTNLL